MSSQKTLPWWKKYVSDWRAGTRGMSLELRGFYGECLDAQWDTQGQLPLDDAKLAMMLGCNPRSIRKLMPQLIALGKIVRTKTGYYNPRMAKDILGVEELPIGGEFDANSDPIQPQTKKVAAPKKGTFDANSSGIRAEFDAKGSKNPMFSTRVLEPDSEPERKKESAAAESVTARESKKQLAAGQPKIDEVASQSTEPAAGQKIEPLAAADPINAVASRIGIKTKSLANLIELHGREIVKSALARLAARIDNGENIRSPGMLLARVCEDVKANPPRVDQSQFIPRGAIALPGGGYVSRWGSA